jgi:hypothetical protein
MAPHISIFDLHPGTANLYISADSYAPNYHHSAMFGHGMQADNLTIPFWAEFGKAARAMRDGAPYHLDTGGLEQATRGAHGQWRETRRIRDTSEGESLATSNDAQLDENGRSNVRILQQGTCI